MSEETHYKDNYKNDCEQKQIFEHSRYTTGCKHYEKSKEKVFMEINSNDSSKWTMQDPTPF
jgi:hypothetical protein